MSNQSDTHESKSIPGVHKFSPFLVPLSKLSLDGRRRDGSRIVSMLWDAQSLYFQIAKPAGQCTKPPMSVNFHAVGALNQLEIFFLQIVKTWNPFDILQKDLGAPSLPSDGQGFFGR